LFIIAYLQGSGDASRAYRSSSVNQLNKSRMNYGDEPPHIGNYRILKTIGKGNFAKVKLARHVLTGREVNKMADTIFLSLLFLNNNYFLF